MVYRKKIVFVLMLALFLALSTGLASLGFAEEAQPLFSYSAWEDASKPADADFDEIDISDSALMSKSSTAAANVEKSFTDKNVSFTMKIGSFGHFTTNVAYSNYRTAFTVTNNSESPVSNVNGLHLSILTSSIVGANFVGYDLVFQNYGTNTNVSLRYSAVAAATPAPTVLAQAAPNNITGNFFGANADYLAHTVEIETYLKSAGAVRVFNIAVDGVSRIHFEESDSTRLASVSEGYFGIIMQQGTMNFSSLIGIEPPVEPETFNPLKTDFNYTEWNTTELPAQIPTLNISDSTVFEHNVGISGGASAIVSNESGITEISTASAAFLGIQTKIRYLAFQTAFDVLVPAGFTSSGVRFPLRTTSATASASQIVGYFLQLSDNTIQVIKSTKQGSAFTTRVYKSNPLTSAYGSMHRIEAQIYNTAAGSVVINYALDGIPYTFIDDGTQEKTAGNVAIPAAEKPPVVDEGNMGVIVNSGTSGKKVTIISKVIEETFTEKFLMVSGSFMEAVTGTAAAFTSDDADGTVTLGSAAGKAYSKKTYLDMSAKITLSTTAAYTNDWFFALALNALSDPKTDFFDPDGEDLNDGYILKVYSGGVKLLRGADILMSFAAAGLDDKLQHNIYVNVKNTIEGNIIRVSIGGIGGMTLLDKGTELSKEGSVMYMNKGTGVTLTGLAYFAKPFRILFCGNSITYHPALATIGWPYFNGMGVPEPEMDYVHQVMAAVKGLQVGGELIYEDAEYKTMGMGEWEKDYMSTAATSANIYNKYAEYRDFQADIIVMRLGENVANAGDTYIKTNPFDLAFASLIDYLKADNENAKVIVGTSYWGSDNPSKEKAWDEAMAKVAKARNYPLIRLGDLGSTYADINNVTADRQYYIDHGIESTFNGFSDGVKIHPGINGMKAIADRLKVSILDLLKGGDGHVQMFKDFSDCNAYIEYKKGDASNVSIEEIVDKSAGFVKYDSIQYAVDSGLILYKLYKVTTDGEYYKLAINYTQDQAIFKDAMFRFVSFDTSDAQTVLTMDDYFYYQEDTTDPRLYVGAQINGYLALYLAPQYDELYKSDANAPGHINKAEAGNFLQFINRNNEKFVIDFNAMSTSLTAVTLGYEIFPYVISSGKDLQIVLGNGSVITVRRDVFEVLTRPEDSLSLHKGLYFSVAALTNANQLENAGTLESTYNKFVKLGGNTLAYNINIRYEDATGDPVAVFTGIKVTIPTGALGIKANETAVLISAEVSLIKNRAPQKVSKETNGFTVSGGSVELSPSYFDRTYILAKDIALEDIEIASQPAKLTYFEGEDIDLTGMEVKEVLSDGSKVGIALASVTTDYDKTDITAGTRDVTVTYSKNGQNYTATFEITIEAIVIESIEITAQPAKLTYTAGEDIDLTGMEVKEVLSDGSKVNIALASVTTDYDKTDITAGTREITVTYSKNGEDYTATFEITVEAVVVTLESIEITANPTKLTYNAGESLDLTGMTVKAVFSDGSKVDIALTEITTNYDSTNKTAGKRNITVTYTADGETYTAAFEITLKAAPKAGGCRGIADAGSAVLYITVLAAVVFLMIRRKIHV